jgi:hypothetical protein
MCGFSLSNRILRINPHDCGTHSGTFEVIMLGINVYSANASTRAIMPAEQFWARFRDAFEGVQRTPPRIGVYQRTKYAHDL